MCSRASGVIHNRRAVGILRFVRARMSENTTQGWVSELQDARMVLILFSDADSQQI